MDAAQLKTLGRKFDLVICHHVLEHLERDASAALIRDIESIATKQIIIGAPVGFTNTEYAIKLHGNENERHKCGWTPKEFSDMGYSILRVYAGAFLAEKKVKPIPR